MSGGQLGLLGVVKWTRSSRTPRPQLSTSGGRNYILHPQNQLASAQSPLESSGSSAGVPDDDKGSAIILRTTVRLMIIRRMIYPLSDRKSGDLRLSNTDSSSQCLIKVRNPGAYRGWVSSRRFACGDGRRRPPVPSLCLLPSF